MATGAEVRHGLDSRLAQQKGLHLRGTLWQGCPVAFQTCSSCGAPIIWCKFATSGKPAPIDAEPVPDGNLVMMPGAKVEAARAGADGPLYKSHFATCPNAKAHRKSR